MDWKPIVLKYQKTCIKQAMTQMGNTLIPFLLLWVAMFYTQKVSFWLTLPFAVVAGGLLVRLFIIFHDCTHGAFFKSKTANDLCGFFMGILTFTSYHQWKAEHAFHHSSSGDLDRRGMGDVWTMTVQEYKNSSLWDRFRYRIVRNPLVLFGFVPLFLFLVINRFPHAKLKNQDRTWLQFSNLIMLFLAIGLGTLYGWKSYLQIQLTILFVTSTAGVWLFYVQHQFEEAYWERSDDWNFEAALEGSSFYKLPRILQWFSGNIGYHHVHHLSPRIPNYRLQEAHDAEPYLNSIRPMTLRTSLKSISFRLWDEKNRRLVGYEALKN